MNISRSEIEIDYKIGNETISKTETEIGSNIINIQKKLYMDKIKKFICKILERCRE